MSTKFYTDAEQEKRGRGYAEHLASLMDIRGKRILEVGAQFGYLSVVLARDYDCEVVGIDPMSYDNWPQVQRDFPQIRLIEGDIASPPAELEENSFDLVVSFVVWEHIRHPWSALKACQRLLKPTGKKFIRANLYRSSIASHLYRRLDEPWPHLMNSPEELCVKLGIKQLGWAFWVNKLTYQQYLFYFRQLGFFITHEKLAQSHFNPSYYSAHEDRLGLYPKWDLSTDFFDLDRPKQPVPDPVYSRMPAG
jgi:SAM-dependent methyltransferase